MGPSTLYRKFPASKLKLA
ncbi:TPA: hypothetical protein ACU91G_002288 [Salmonella enterica]